MENVQVTKGKKGSEGETPGCTRRYRFCFCWSGLVKKDGRTGDVQSRRRREGKYRNLPLSRYGSHRGLSVVTRESWQWVETPATGRETETGVGRNATRKSAKKDRVEARGRGLPGPPDSGDRRRGERNVRRRVPRWGRHGGRVEGTVCGSRK